MALFDFATGILYHVLAMLLTTCIVSFNDGSISLGCSVEPVSIAPIEPLSNLGTVVVVLFVP